MNYYYFAATLPGLTLDASPPFTVEAFLLRCAEALRPADLLAVRQITGRDTSAASHPVVRRWQAFETHLRNALVRVRALRLHGDPTPFLRPTPDDDTRVDKMAADAMARTAPLEREQALDRFRWQQAEALAGYNPFSSEALMAYALKLTLAARWAGLSDDAGRKRTDALVSHTETTAGAAGIQPASADSR